MNSIIRSPLLWLAIASTIYITLIVKKVTPYVGGSDSSGYYNSALLLGRGQIGTTPRIIPGLPVSTPDIPADLYVPLGFRSETDTHMVPTYAIGLPLMIFIAACFVGWLSAPAWVAGCHMFFGVIVTYGTARQCGLRPAWSWFASWIMAFSPLFIKMGLQPMTDVPALTWCTAVVFFALKAQKQAYWGGLCGFCLGVAVLLRPTNIFISLPVVVLLVSRPKTWLWVVSGAVPCLLFLGLYNYAAYGKALTTGYGDVSDCFSQESVVPTLRHYLSWIPRIFTPLTLLALGLPWSGANKSTITFIGAWIFPFLIFYSFYLFTHENWWYLRYILPSIPAVIIASILVLKRIAERFHWELFDPHASQRSKIITVLLIVVTGLSNGLGVYRLNALLVKYEEKNYWLIAEWLNKNVPSNSVIVAMQNSGTLTAYSSFIILRWDAITEKNRLKIHAQLATNNQPLYAALHPFEQAETFARLPGNWRQLTNIRSVTVWEYQPAPH